MARNDLRWNNVQADFGSSNQANAIGSQMLSNAGNMFSKVAEYTQEEAKRLNEERNKLFESAGKELSNLALQEGIEATVLPDGSVRHTFNAEKYDQAVSRIATERGYDQLGEDARTKIWASLRTDTDYQLGLANNQANAQNDIDRNKLALERKKLNQQDIELNKDLFANTRDFYINYLLNPNSKPEDKERTRETVVHTIGQVTDPTEKAYLNTILYLIDNPKEVDAYLYTSKDKTAIDNYEGMQNLYTRIGGNIKDTENNAIMQNIKQQSTKDKEKKLFNTSINNGTLGINTINNVSKTKGITSLESEAMEESLGKLINIYASSLSLNKDMTPKDIQTATESWLSNNLKVKIDEDKNKIGTINIDTEELINDLIQGNNTKEVKKVFGTLSETQFNNLSKTAQKMNNININTTINSNINNDKSANKNYEQQKIQEKENNKLAKKYNFSNNNITEPVYHNLNKNKTTLDNLYKEVSANENLKTEEARRHISSKFKYNFVKTDFLPTNFKNFIDQQIEKSEYDNITPIVLDFMTDSTEFSIYKRKIKNYEKSKFLDDKLKNEIEQYEQGFINAYNILYKNLEEMLRNKMLKNINNKQKSLQNRKEFYGE